MARGLRIIEPSCSGIFFLISPSKWVLNLYMTFYPFLFLMREGNAILAEGHWHVSSCSYFTRNDVWKVAIIKWGSWGFLLMDSAQHESILGPLWLAHYLDGKTKQIFPAFIRGSKRDYPQEISKIIWPMFIPSTYWELMLGREPKTLQLNYEYETIGPMNWRVNQ